MIQTHNLGFPRIGANRELKFAQEAYWRKAISAEQLQATAQQLRRENWQAQASCDWLAVGDFSLYDHVLDMSFLLGNIPERFTHGSDSTLNTYFQVARGQSQTGHTHHTDNHCGSNCQAGEMTKWFDSNYHYIVPELTADSEFSLHSDTLLAQIDEAQTFGGQCKPVIIGPVTYLYLAKTKDGSDKLALLDKLLPLYNELLEQIANKNIEWVQIDEPILVTELDLSWRQALDRAYHRLKSCRVKLLLTSYFGELKENLPFACQLPVAAIHIDAISAANEITQVVDWLPAHKILSLGVINGRNIWKTDLNKTLDWLQPLAEKLQDRLWLAPSCSLLHVPVDLTREQKLDPEIKSWLAFAVQKLEELNILKTALNQGRAAVERQLVANQTAIDSRKHSQRVHKPQVQAALKEITPTLGERQSSYSVRIKRQQQKLKLPLYPTTTIGSFPQTAAIRQSRREFKQGQLNHEQYQHQMREYIAQSVQAQEDLALDVLVHGEAERNDMVEYFGEHLEGYAFSEFGWVQSYGSRCVKPPILFGDIVRPHAISVDWTNYAQSLTQKPMKGMLTGPVTLLNWSFVRDDQPRRLSCLQLALAVRQEVQDLEKSGVHIIQIDEAALREGLPLRKSQWQDYLDWAVTSYRISANGVSDATQIHTHMCYSEFNDIISAIAHMDADVITIETSRSDMELLDVFDEFKYPNEIGPGVYDIHSPNIPTQQQIISLMEKAARRIAPERLWVNPDCGLKTRQWPEVVAALKNMVDAAKTLRTKHQQTHQPKDTVAV